VNGPDVEVQHFLPDAEFLIQRDRRLIDVIRLHEYRASAALGRDGGESLEERGGDAPPAEGLRDGEI